MVADGRSPITRNWIRMLSGLDFCISLVSTFPYEPIPAIEKQYTLPVAFSSFAGGQVAVSNSSRQSRIRRIVSILRPILLRLRALAAPLTLARQQEEFLRIVADLQPDIVHALRVPYEGMLASVTPREIPFVVSIWGNDLTLHARTSPMMAAQTRRTLRRANGLLADAARDLHLAREWGLPEDAPRMVLPGNGGLDLQEVNRILSQRIQSSFQFPEGRTLVVNPRGFRPGSVHQDVFFRSLPRVVEEFPDVLFVCTAMRGQRQAVKWVGRYGLQDHVLLLPYLPQTELWQLFSRSLVYVSLSSHDGTPNTLLEALACGCFPVVGDIESLREWLDDGRNGLLVDPRDAQAASAAIIRALRHAELRQRARQYNIKLLKERAEISKIRKQIQAFYSRFFT